MKTILFLSFLITGFSLDQSQALSVISTTSSTATTNISTLPLQYKVQVNGLVCDFCARALEKVFGREKAVESIKVDLNSKHIVLNLKPNQQIAESRIKKLITDSGYHFVKMETLHGKP